MSAQINIKRLAGVLMPVLSIVSVLATFGVAIHLVFPTDRLASFQSTTTPGEFESVGRQINLRVNYKQSKRGEFGIVVGASTAGTAHDFPSLQSELGFESNWLGLYPSGANLSDLKRVVELYRKFGLNPDMLVFAINPMMLADIRTGTNQIELVDLPTMHVKGIIAGALNFLWPNTFTFNRSARNALFQSKLKILEQWNQDTLETVFGTVTPKSEANFVHGPHPSRFIVENDLKAFKELGKYREEGYTSEGINANDLSELIRNETRRGTRVYVVLLPESTTFRKIIPSNAKRQLEIVLARVCDGKSAVKIDLSTFLDDAYFWDYHHINWFHSGPKSYSRELGKRIAANYRDVPKPKRD